jgi:hypothetical protein
MEICRNGNHTLIEIMRKYVGYDTDHVVRWCTFCGAVVVDVETDNRLMNHFEEMRFPKLMDLHMKKS